VSRKKLITEIITLSTGLLVDKLTKPILSLPGGSIKKKKKNKKINNLDRGITKTQADKMKNLLKDVSDKKLKTYTEKYLDSFMTRRLYNKLIIEVQDNVEKTLNQKETGFFESDKKRQLREKVLNTNNKNKKIDTQKQRHSNFLLTGIYETNSEKQKRRSENILTKIEILKTFKPNIYDKLIAQGPAYAKLEIQIINKMSIESFEKDFNIKTQGINFKYFNP